MSPSHRSPAFARQCGCVASVSFDGGGLTPDGQVHTLETTWYFDVSGVHILAPSHLRSATPGSAVAARVVAKHRKYDDYAANHQSKFVPVVLDRFGSMAKESEDFLEAIANEKGSGTRASPLGSPSSFRNTISKIWQVGNARILRERCLLCRPACRDMLGLSSILQVGYFTATTCWDHCCGCCRGK